MAYCKDAELVVVDTVNWDTISTFRYRTNTAAFTLCRYSPCGNFLAAGTVTGDICVWRVRSGEPIDILNKDDAQTQPITTIDWNPTSSDGEMAYTDNSGQLGTITHDKLPSDGDDKAVGVDTANELFDDESSNPGALHGMDQDDDDNENCVSLERLKNVTMKNHGLNRSADGADDDIDALLEHQTAARPSALVSAFQVVPLQEAFQPAATPAQLEHRYMVWNSVGIVRAHNTDAENSIEVDFHDATVHHSIHMSNYLNHTMASLSRTVLALAKDVPR